MLLTALALTIGQLAADPAPAVRNNLMPEPAELKFMAGRFAVTPEFSVVVRGHDDARLREAIARALRRCEERTGLTFGANEEIASSKPALIIECQGPGQAIPSLAENESYSLEITSTQVTLRAATVVGAIRGLETLLQLLGADADGYFFPVAVIHDQPRFPWRGLLIDVCRHWQPIEVIKRNLDGMALVKLNVLHLHLSEDQGFRIESKKFPELQKKGSDGNYFTQEQMRDIIAYAAARGIRVVPEFDVPGHATSWVVSHPELASLPGKYSIERRWGVFDPVLDPTNEKTYELLDGFLGEMCALFPDTYIHIGGDENNGKQWTASPAIQEFIQDHNLKDNAGLHTYFNSRVHEILKRHGKSMIGWDEILHPDLPHDSVIQSWRGADGLADAVQRGFKTILSHGYYIDLMYSTAQHYTNDPLPAANGLSAAEQKLILGGEATMWSEWVSPENIDSRIWPRTAAIAERLWSPRDVNDVSDMCRRLDIVSARLEEAGLLHEKNRDPMLRRLAGDNATEAERLALRVFVDAVEPVKEYTRGGYQKDATQFTPLTGLVDCARPDSRAAREFAGQVEKFIFAEGKPDAKQLETIARQLQIWIAAGDCVATQLSLRSPQLRAVAPAAKALADASRVASEALKSLDTGTTPAADWQIKQFALLNDAAHPRAAVELPIIPAIKLLVSAAAEQNQRAQFSTEEWRRHLEKQISKLSEDVKLKE